MAQTLPVSLTTGQPEKSPKPEALSQTPEDDCLPKFLTKDRVLPPPLSFRAEWPRPLAVHILPDVFYPHFSYTTYDFSRNLHCILAYDYHQQYPCTVEHTQSVFGENHETLALSSILLRRPDNNHEFVENTLPALQNDERVKTNVTLTDLQECIDKNAIAPRKLEKSRQQVINSLNQSHPHPSLLLSPPDLPLDIGQSTPIVEPRETQPSQPPPAARTQLVTKPFSRGIFRHYNPVDDPVNDHEEQRRRKERRREQNREASRHFRERQRLANQRKAAQLAYLENKCAELTCQLEKAVSRDFCEPEMVGPCLPGSQFEPLMSPPFTNYQNLSPTEPERLQNSPCNPNVHR
ncbi:hypothetical protein IWQ62_002596 [Dispira parvispora]|uniref:BZIP domain-containing protein n=1 Tax=Dispira parvispora TaxID=1520584 RepID=A0A9W8E7B3_9FUNG|nr:hypothetical protein IWQ62_002596 [Dispira parvispora]